jgi:GNAT superfamily N-acetyltransferase
MLLIAAMPELSITESLSEAHEHQVRSFIRLHWHDEYLYSIDAPLVPAWRHPRHVIVADRHALISHGRVIWVPFEHQGETHRLYCLGDVLTYPAFRRRGHGGAVTKAATDLIRSDPEADLAILFCDPKGAGFYERHGWTAVPELVAMRGFGDERERQEGLAMVLRLSDRGRAADLVSAPLMLPGYGW